MPERRDYIGEDSDPVTEYYRKRDDNKKFFRLRSEEKVDLSRFDRTNYMTSPSPMVGVTKQKNYLTNKRVQDFIDVPEKSEGSKRYVFDETMKRGSNTSRNMQEKLKRDSTIEQFKIMKRIISNEKKVSGNIQKIETPHSTLIYLGPRATKGAPLHDGVTEQRRPEDVQLHAGVRAAPIQVLLI